jgi:hypothetical protein
MEQHLRMTGFDASAVEAAFGDSKSDSDSDGSDVSVASVDLDPLGSSVPVDVHVKRNADALAGCFKWRRLGKLGVVLWKATETDVKFKVLHASSLKKHKYMQPVLYRFPGLFKAGELSQLIAICRLNRGLLHTGPDPEWVRLRSHIINSGMLSQFEYSLGSERSLSRWFTTLCGLVSAHLSGDFVLLKYEALLGLSGPLAYKDPETDEIDLRAGYIGKADLLFPLGPSHFAGVECKIVSDAYLDLIWYTPRAVLSQTMCWLSAAAESRVCLVVCNLGIKLVYRIPRETMDCEGQLVFDYYSYPPADPLTGRSYFLPCRGEHAQAGLEQLLRIIYELIKVTMSSPMIPVRPKTPEPISAELRDPLTNSPKRRPRSEGSDDCLPKSPVDIENAETPSHAQLNDPESPECTGVISYSFKAALPGDVMLQCEGHQYPALFFEDEV